MSWRETHCFTFQECLVQGCFLLCFFLFWETKRLFSGKSGQQTGPVPHWRLNMLFLKQQLLSREETLLQCSRFLLWCHTAGFMIFGFFSCFKKLPSNYKTHLEYSISYSFISKLMLIQSYLPKKDSAFTTGKILFSRKFLLFLGHSEYWQTMWPFLMAIICFSLNNKPFSVSIVFVWISSRVLMMLLVAFNYIPVETKR